ncbi:MAG: hypothetical protein GTO63_08370 [Anaerolineae bacterium]|nr:hypothetical protein [Anaerolineae bacterium]NIN94917.1 hypothetical protein [Anaerolineae bacterium]NIQ80058.1 hypothetical protein [Anaerolineae bacterium]
MASEVRLDGIYASSEDVEARDVAGQAIREMLDGKRTLRQVAELFRRRIVGEVTHA